MAIGTLSDQQLETIIKYPNDAIGLQVPPAVENAAEQARYVCRTKHSSAALCDKLCGDCLGAARSAIESQKPS